MKKITFLLTTLLMCLALASCSLFGGDEKSETAEESSSDSEDYYEAGANDSDSSESKSSDDNDEGDEFPARDGGTTASDDVGNEGVDTDVAFGEDRDIPEDNSSDMTPDMTPEPEETVDVTPDVTPDPEPAPMSKPKKSLASTNFKQGMYDFNQDCVMRADPDDSGAVAGTIKAPKKLWVEPFDGNWLRVYKKSGPVFINKSCVE